MGALLGGRALWGPWSSEGVPTSESRDSPAPQVLPAVLILSPGGATRPLEVGGSEDVGFLRCRPLETAVPVDEYEERGGELREGWSTAVGEDDVAIAEDNERSVSESLLE